MVEVKSNPELTIPQGATFDVKLAFIVFVACIFFACYVEFVPYWESQANNNNVNHSSKQLKESSTEPISFETFLPVASPEEP